MLCCFVVLHAQDYELSYFTVTLEEPSYSPPPFTSCFLYLLYQKLTSVYSEFLLNKIS